MEVLAQVTMGLSVEQIAEAMAIQPATVKRHIRRLCRKLGVDSAEEAAAMTMFVIPVADEVEG
ncbi:MAG: helix-turn-helix transcriptional regulator [Caldilineaceae bacterium]|nr:helix-turn-helix transcriptional regulator [Caldilineaceae bacterium]